jgi:uncharacterized protein YggU (UPF0235/DUF167 family)
MTITVTVKPRSKKQELRETAPGFYEARVIAAPEGGKANAEMLALLARHFKVAKSRILITAGAAAKRKMVEIF